MVFRDEQSLKAALDKKLQKAAKRTVNKVLTKYKQLIISDVYGAYNPFFYSRTFDFYRAWSTENVDDGARMFYNTTSMSSFPPYHASVVDGKDSSDFLPDILYTTCKKGIFTHGDWNKKRMAWDKLDRWFSEDRLRKEFQRGMDAQHLKYVSHRGQGITKEDII